MSFKFRFPIALLDMLKSDDSRFGTQNVIEKAREWAVRVDETEKRKRPTLLEAEQYLNAIIEDDKQEKDDRAAKREYI